MGSYSILMDFEKDLKENCSTHECIACGCEFISQKGKLSTKCPKCESYATIDV